VAFLLGLLDTADKDSMIFYNLLSTHPTTQCHITGDMNLQQHGCGNIRPQEKVFIMKMIILEYE